MHNILSIIEDPTIRSIRSFPYFIFFTWTACNPCTKNLKYFQAHNYGLLSHGPAVFSNGQAAVLHRDRKLWVWLYRDIQVIKSLTKHFLCLSTVGYTMSDIRYKWNDGLNSVQISADVSLPQFKVLGHRQKAIEASLSTGNCVWLSVRTAWVRNQEPHCHFIIK